MDVKDTEKDFEVRFSLSRSFVYSHVSEGRPKDFSSSQI